MGIEETTNSSLTELLPYLVIILGVAVLILFILVMVLFAKAAKDRRRLELFLNDANGASLEERLDRVLEDNQKFRTQLKNSVGEIVKLNEGMLTSFRKIGVVKFNAFPGMAGKVSSSVCLLNNENNGIIINSIHGQDGCYTYVKEIMNGKSVAQLTDEEEEALKKALDS